MATNLTTVNNLSISGLLTASNNIISTGSLQTTAITSTSINNSNSISTNSINSTNASLTNTSINVLTLLANTPIIFNYNGSNYNLSTLMLYTLNQLSGATIASQSYVNTQISSLVNSSPDLLNTLSELATAINNDASFSTTMTNLIATKSSLSGNNIFTGSNTFGNDVSGNIISRLFSTILSINTGNTRRNVANFFECAMGATSSYIYYDNTGKFGSINTSDSTLNWNIGLNSVFNINTINSVNENISGNGIINNLYSNILAINNNNTRRSTNDIFECCTSSTSNYLYYNNSSTFGHINTSNSASSWFINSSGAATLPSLTTTTGTVTTLNSTTGTITTLTSTTGAITTLTSTTGTITNLYSNILAINNNNTQRASNDIFEVATSSTGNYLYYNNSSVFGHINTTTSTNSWFIDSNGLAKITKLTVNSTLRSTNDLFNVSTSSTGNYLYYNSDSVFGHIHTNTLYNWYINASGICSLQNLCIGSANMRTSTDRLNVSVSNSGPYLFFNDGGTLGTYNTNTSSFPWFIEMDGDSSFQSVNCNKLSVDNIKRKTVVMNVSYEFNLLTTSPQMIYLNSASESIFFNLTPLGESCNFNIYEFRLMTSNVNSIMRFRGSNTDPTCPIIDLNNNSTLLFNDDSKQRYYRFQYIYQFPGGSVINTYYQLK